MPNSQEEAIDRQIIFAFVGFALAVHHMSAFHASIAVQAQRIRFEKHFNLFVVQHPILHRLGSPQVRFTHNHVYFRCQTSQIRCLLASRIAATHDSYHFLAIEEPITSGTSRHTKPLILRFIGQSEILRRCTGSNDQRIGQYFALIVERQHERTLRQISFHAHLVAHFRTEALCLLAKVLHQLVALHAFGIAGEVFDLRRLRELSPRLKSFVNHRRKTGTAGINSSSVARRAAAEYESFEMFHKKNVVNMRLSEVYHLHFGKVFRIETEKTVCFLCPDLKAGNHNRRPRRSPRANSHLLWEI